MENDHKFECKRRKDEGIYEIKCKGEGEEEAQPKTMYCTFTMEGKSGGASGLGFGAQYGETTPVLRCFSEDEFKKEIAKELGTEEDNINIVDEEQ